MMNTFEQFDLSRSYVLENEKVRLSPLSTGDVYALRQIAKAPQIWTYFLEDGYGDANFVRYLEAALDQQKQAKEYPFVVFDKVKNQVAGMTRLYDFIPELQTIKMGHTWYGTSFQGSGINKQCKFLLFEFAFEILGMERIGFGVHGENLRSIAALKSVGCQQEGVLRNFLVSTTLKHRVDLLYFSILKEEWFNTVKESLISKLT